MTASVACTLVSKLVHSHQRNNGRVVDPLIDTYFLYRQDRLKMHNLLTVMMGDGDYIEIQRAWGEERSEMDRHFQWVLLRFETNAVTNLLVTIQSTFRS